MDCRQAQRLWDDWSDGRLSPPLASQLQRHLADCTDCRVARQRAGRLQQLLSVKRHETPGPAYFDGFVSEFHRRLEAPETRAPWYHRLAEQLPLESPVWTYACAGAATATLLLSLGWLWWGTPGSSPTTAASQPRQQTSQPLAIAGPAAPLNLPAAADTSWPPAVVLAPAAPNAASQPRYVLDRITITPASYEPGSVRF